MATKKPELPETPEEPTAASAFVPAPIPHGHALRVLGPRPEDGATAVEPLVKLDEPLTLVQSFIAGVCDPHGRLLQSAEVMLVVDPSTVVPDRQIPTEAVLELFSDLPELRAKLPTPVGFEILQQALAAPERIGPLLYCRKMRRLFAAQPAPDGESIEVIAALDDLIQQQRDVVEREEKLQKRNRVAAEHLAEEHACARCPESERCYPQDDGYAYVTDRLVAVSAARAPFVVAPLGEWRFDEASRMMGGVPPSEGHPASGADDNAFQAWRAERAMAMERSAPPWLLSREIDGRELIEVARLKLGLIADVLAQVDAVWRASARPHLCWNEETVRVARRPNVQTPAFCWGFQPLLRKSGLHPLAPVVTHDDRPTSYPPAFSDPTFLPTVAAEAARYFDDPRKATLFVKKPQTGDGIGMQVLLEDLGVPWELFRTCDTLEIVGDGWSALLMPVADRDPDDGDGLPFHGRATGAAADWKKGDQINDVECSWRPRFDQAVDLHAVGVLMFESLLAHNERHGSAFREELAGELAELSKTCMALPIEQREEQVRIWITERCEADAPAAIWTRRNLLYRRDDRNSTRLDAFPAALWRAILLFGLRLTTGIPGFSFCDDRGAAAPRLGDELLLPLVELRGLIALLDDLVFGRTAATEAAVSNVNTVIED